MIKTQAGQKDTPMRTPAIIALSAVAVAVVFGGSAVGVTEIVTHHPQPVAAAKPAPAKTVIIHKKKAVHRTIAEPAPASNGNAAPAVGQAPINNLRQVEPGVYANQNTSDAFTENVVSAWDGVPGVQSVYSPVTGQTYPMTYTDQGNGTIIATGGNGAYVEFPAG